LQTLLLFNKKEHFSALLNEFLTNSVDLLNDLSIKPYSFAEFKYLNSLKEIALNFVMCLVNMLDIEKDSELLNVTFNKSIFDFNIQNAAYNQAMQNKGKVMDSDEDEPNEEEPVESVNANYNNMSKILEEISNYLLNIWKKTLIEE
jgi:hypothetical protein